MGSIPVGATFSQSRTVRKFPITFYFLWMTAGLMSCGSNSAPSDEKATLKNIDAILREHTCLACHRVDAPLVGPSYIEIASRGYSASEIIELIEHPRPENWPNYPPMAAVQSIPADELETIAAWIISLKNTNN